MVQRVPCRPIARPCCAGGFSTNERMTAANKTEKGRPPRHVLEADGGLTPAARSSMSLPRPPWKCLERAKNKWFHPLCDPPNHRPTASARAPQVLVQSASPNGRCGNGCHLLLDDRCFFLSGWSFNRRLYLAAGALLFASCSHQGRTGSHWFLC